MTFRLDILDTIIDNGRVELSKDPTLAADGVSDLFSLTTEAEFECSERGLSKDETAEVVAYCLDRCSHD